MGVGADDQARIDPDRTGTVAVVRLVVDEDRIRCLDPDRFESGEVDRGLRLPRADLEREDQRVELLLEPEPRDDRSGVVRAVTDERRLHTVRSERPYRGDRVVEQTDAGRPDLLRAYSASASWASSSAATASTIASSASSAATASSTTASAASS